MLSPNQCANALYFPLLASLSLIAVSSIITVIGNLPGDFLVRMGRKIKILLNKVSERKIKEQDLGTVNRTDDNLESLKLTTQEELLKRMFQEKTLFKELINVKLSLLMWASCLLVANFLTILVLIFMKYYYLKIPETPYLPFMK